MKGEWCYFKSYLDKSICEKIINDVQIIPVQEARVGDNGFNSNVNTDVRRTKIRFLHAGDWRFEYIFDIFWKTCISANDDFFQFNVSKLSYIQFAEYNSNELAEYKPHHDVFWLNNDPVYHRKLSAVIQLSDSESYTGGNLELLHVGTTPLASDLRKQGTIIYFPSFITHQVTPVTSGVRYSMTAWFEGKKWC